MLKNIKFYPNDENQQSKLIKVNLNEYQKSKFYNFPLPMPPMPPMVNFMALNFMAKQSLGFGAPRRMKMNFAKSINCSSAAPKYKSGVSYEMSFKRAERPRKENYNPPPPPPPPQPQNIIKDDITRIIMSQDIIEGFWEENEETKKIINIITLDKFNHIKNNVISLKKGTNEMKIIYTILVIYYLNTKCTARLNEFRLVLNKANKFLTVNGIKYENIISGI